MGGTTIGTENSYSSMVQRWLANVIDKRSQEDGLHWYLGLNSLYDLLRPKIDTADRIEIESWFEKAKEQTDLLEMCGTGNFFYHVRIQDKLSDIMEKLGFLGG